MRAPVLADDAARAVEEAEEPEGGEGGGAEGDDACFVCLAEGGATTRCECTLATHRACVRDLVARVPKHADGRCVCGRPLAGVRYVRVLSAAWVRTLALATTTGASCLLFVGTTHAFATSPLPCPWDGYLLVLGGMSITTGMLGGVAAILCVRACGMTCTRVAVRVVDD